MSTTTTQAQDAEPNTGVPANVDEAAGVADPISNLEDDCIFSILSFLHHSDLNSFALCSRRCREARSVPSLDQTRTGVVVCSETTSILESEIASVRQLYKAFDVGRWNNDLYSGNRTHLRVVGFGRQGKGDEVLFGEAKQVLHSYARGNGNVQLTGVTNLDLSCSPQDVSNQFTCQFVVYALALILPNLQELDLSYRMGTGNAIQIFSTVCRNLTRVTVKGSFDELFVGGSQFVYLTNLTDLNLDGSRLRMEWGHQEAEYESENESLFHFMWMYCRKLQRLSMKNVFLTVRQDSKPISQAMIIKLVRHHPTLQWIRSDLTQENTTMLQQERPHITFVVE